MIWCAVCIPNWPNKVSIYDPAGVPPYSCLIEGSYQTSYQLLVLIYTYQSVKHLFHLYPQYLRLFWTIGPQTTPCTALYAFFHPRGPQCVILILFTRESIIMRVPSQTVFEMQSFLYFTFRSYHLLYSIYRVVLHSNICCTGRFSSWVI